MQPKQFDTIVIGSGIGGLAVASLLAQIRGQRVCVLERHFTAGGFTHEFKRPGGFRWDVGVHYVGSMQAKSPYRRLLDLICGRPIRWQSLPDPFERFSFPGLDFGLYAGRRRFVEGYSALFPKERRAIERYSKEVFRCSTWLGARTATQLSSLRVLARPALKLWQSTPLSTTQSYLDQHFRSPELKALLTSQWGDYGIPPEKSAFAMHAIIAAHYMGGAYYPEGGSARFAGHVAKLLQKRDGELRVNHQVTRILCEKGRAIGVEVRKTGRKERLIELRADRVVSAAGADITYRQLIDPQKLAGRARQQVEQACKDIEALPAGPSHVALYLGLCRDPRTLGFRGENHWIYRDLDHNAAAKRAELLKEGIPPFAYLSFPSLKDPTATCHTAEIITIGDCNVFGDWKDLPWKRRGEQYEALKGKIADGLLELVESRYPGFRELVCYQELSTPLSTTTFTGYPGGAIYGLPAVPARYALSWLGYRTPVENLYLTGSDAFAHGFVGAMMSGAFTAAHIMGGQPGMFRIFKSAYRHF
jgi:all-trans-retinol 13,14-reductase